ncbi:MAG: hypothetical protein CM1200mP15_03090 [Dehalococcoidia bacterium]|nr:MAG: hypothetical protein CM1200mP15_03090 [Dehalococcoidia bacterium]
MRAGPYTSRRGRRSDYRTIIPHQDVVITLSQKVILSVSHLIRTRPSTVEVKVSVA